MAEAVGIYKEGPLEEAGRGRRRSAGRKRSRRRSAGRGEEGGGEGEGGGMSGGGGLHMKSNNPILKDGE